MQKNLKANGSVANIGFVLDSYSRKMWVRFPPLLLENDMIKWVCTKLKPYSEKGKIIEEDNVTIIHCKGCSIGVFEYGDPLVQRPKDSTEDFL